MLKITGGRAQTDFMIRNVTHVLPWTLKLPHALSFCVFCHVPANTHCCDHDWHMKVTIKCEPLSFISAKVNICRD